MAKIKMNEISNDNKILLLFAGTFAFLASHKPKQKNKKELASQRTTTDRNEQIQHDRKNNEPLTAPKKIAGEVRIQTFVQLIKFGGCRQFSVPNPPLLVAAKRYA